ncbi:hypothetical protein GCM10009616_14250 [Microlunatus lacustris]
MSYHSVHPTDPTGQPLVSATSLRVSRAAARSYALQQAVTERRALDRAPRPARISIWRRARRVVVRPRPA